MESPDPPPTSSTSSRLPITGRFRHGDPGTDLIALTFDDTPHPVYVPRLLALFRAEKVKATFFVVGEQVKLFPDLVRAIVADGHEIGNHSLTHRDLRRAPPSAVDSEILGLQRLLKDRLGIEPRVYRPAYGAVNEHVKRLCARESLPIVTWNVDPEDWKSDVTREMIVENVLENTTSGSIVLCHGTREKTVQAVAEVIPVLRFRGFRFATVSELLLDRAAREKERAASEESADAAEANESESPPTYGPEATEPEPPPINLPDLPTP